MDTNPDALSDVLRNIELKACIYFIRSMPAPWGLDMPAAANGPLHLVLDGQCLLRSQGKEIFLHQGDAVMLPHGDQHQMLDHPDTTPEPGPLALKRLADDTDKPNGRLATTMLCGHFEWDTAFEHPLLKELPAVIVVRNAFGQPDAARVRSIVNLISVESTDKRPGGAAIADRMGEALFVSLLRNWMIEQQPQFGLLASLNDAKLCRVLSHIHQYPDQELDLEKLASIAGMSRTAFATRFKQVLGIPPAAYLADWRMLSARRMLLRTALPTAHIIDRIGYGSDAAFVRAFKRKFGETPGSLRRRYSTTG